MESIRLLIADDDRVIIATLAENLMAHGYSVQTASNGAEAVDVCRSGSPDLAILDIRMPVMSGIDAARIIHNEFGTPVLFLSAYSDKELVDQAVAEGALGYLVKPVNTEKLIPAITAALARARDMRAATEAQQHLTRAIKTRREVDIAVGILLERFNLTRDLAFEVLRNLARSNNRKLTETAIELVERSELFVQAQKIALNLLQAPKEAK